MCKSNKTQKVQKGEHKEELSFLISDIAKFKKEFVERTERILGSIEDIQEALKELPEDFEQLKYNTEELDVSNIYRAIEFASVVGEFSNSMVASCRWLGTECQTLLENAKELCYDYGCAYDERYGDD